MIAGYLTAMRRYGVFDGRAARSEYWWFKLALAVLISAALGIDHIISGGAENANAPLTSLVLLTHVLPSVALDARRLHDLDRSGWFVLLGLIPLVGPVILLIWFCRPGTSGPNRFGRGSFDDEATSPAAVERRWAPTRSAYPLATAVRDVVAEIERLARLRASGSLSEAEFEVLKARVVAADGRV